MISLNSINLGTLNLGGMNTSEIKLGYPSSGCPVPGLKGLQGFYMGKGLTNEMMSRDPVWRDKSGKGNHIALKNFGWKLDSGCGKYAQDFTFAGIYLSKVLKKTNSSIEIETTSEVWNNTVISIGSVNWRNTPTKVYISRVGVIIYAYYNNDKHIELTQGANGSIVTIPALTEEQLIDLKFLQICINGNYKAGVRLSIEQIPDYDGAICFDGVDDFGETIKDLNFTDNYSVVSLVVPFYRPKNQVMFGKNYQKDVYSNFSTSLAFFSVGKAVSIGSGQLGANKARLLVCRRNDSVQEIKDMLSNLSSSVIPIPIIDNPGKYYLGKSQTVFQYGQFAMFAHAIFDHYISDNELQILSDYWKKEFPELFPDQAWTVTGKTNSDADRATIKNITGNGNDLVLTNFAFAENSGYGLYKQNFNTSVSNKWHIATARVDATKTSSFFNITSVKQTLVSLYYQSAAEELSSVIPSFRVRITGLTDGQTISYIYFIGDTLKFFNMVSDGVYDLPSFEFQAKGGFYGFRLNKIQESCDITIEQIPDYEGYLVTDGVDDRVISSNFILPEKYTIVGDWELINNTNDACGITKPNQFYIYNRSNGVRIFVNSTNSAFDVLCKSIKAVCSDGRCYDSEWNEISFVPGNITNSGGALYIGYLSAHFTQMAFKNLGIYNNTILNKDQSIRAYNYLQTIKNN